eukprot:TRINITY_DN10532_c0_g1_i2.p2 TRINITY_DN10532_c0_g1~~TRINITY_DN10532_c0_g1_i2.p2  ORF type:complete len:332 (+),score=61.51 TRINITY_DN10532_c0_g1_i2:1292-2287(+)
MSGAGKRKAEEAQCVSSDIQPSRVRPPSAKTVGKAPGFGAPMPRSRRGRLEHHERVPKWQPDPAKIAEALANARGIPLFVDPCLLQDHPKAAANTSNPEARPEAVKANKQEPSNVQIQTVLHQTAPESILIRMGAGLLERSYTEDHLASNYPVTVLLVHAKPDAEGAATTDLAVLLKQHLSDEDGVYGTTEDASGAVPLLMPKQDLTLLLGMLRNLSVSLYTLDPEHYPHKTTYDPELPGDHFMQFHRTGKVADSAKIAIQPSAYYPRPGPVQVCGSVPNEGLAFTYGDHKAYSAEAEGSGSASASSRDISSWGNGTLLSCETVQIAQKLD